MGNAADSGASESVVADDMIANVATVEGEAMRKGAQSEVADGTLIPNLWENQFVAVSDGGIMRQMKAQMCEANKVECSQGSASWGQGCVFCRRKFRRG